MKKMFARRTTPVRGKQKKTVGLSRPIEINKKRIHSDEKNKTNEKKKSIARQSNKKKESFFVQKRKSTVLFATTIKK